MKVALIGNQNSGKTTLFNYLTGMNAKVGNWPGVTIEKKTGIIKGTKYEITDLPGIYSLSPYSVEEEVSRKFIFEEKPDVIINIVDSTSLERSLYLTTQLMELDVKLIIALNMADILEKRGISIDIAKLEEKLGTKVYKISALKETGIKELINGLSNKEKFTRPHIFDSQIEIGIEKIQKEIQIPHGRFVSVKLLEEDNRFVNYRNREVKEVTHHLEEKYDTDLEEEIATQRYSFIENAWDFSVEKKEKEESLSDKLDKIFLNKWIAFPIFAIIMFLVYYVSVGVVGNITTEWISNMVNNIGEWTGQVLQNIGTSTVIQSLVVDGIIAGVGALLSFIPQLIILFLCIALLETTGYMSRISMLLDKFFKKIGLNGKSLIPFIVGSGCSVPGIMGTRIIENQHEREMTVILTPFIPCSAKLPIIALFTGYFFKENTGVVSASLYFFAIIIIILSALIFSKTKLRHTSNTFISELPEYKLPSLKYLVKDVWDKVFDFIKRAGSVILICSVVIWFLLSFSFNLEYGVNIQDSMLAGFGKTISWIFYPMLGQNSWEATVSAIQGLIAKEQVVSSMAVISGLSESIEEGSQIFTSGTAFSSFTAASAYAFMVFNLFSAPCIGAISAMRRELGSTKKLIKAILFQTTLAWVLATIVYQIGNRIETGTIKLADILVITAILIAIIYIIIKKTKNNDKSCSSCPYYKSCK